MCVCWLGYFIIPPQYSMKTNLNPLNEKNANRHDLLNQMPTFCCLYDFEYFHTEIVAYLYICNTVYYTYDYIAIS